MFKFCTEFWILISFGIYLKIKIIDKMQRAIGREKDNAIEWKELNINLINKTEKAIVILFVIFAYLKKPVLFLFWRINEAIP